MGDAWGITPRGELCWPDPAAVEGFGRATGAVRRVVAQAAAVTPPVHGLLCQWTVYPWWRGTGDLGPSSWIPGHVVQAAGRKAAYDALHRRLVDAVDAAGWYGGVVAANATDHPVTKLYHALTGAAISDVDPWRAALLSRMWTDAMPPRRLTDPAAVLLWCRLRAGGASRRAALRAVHGVLCSPVDSA